MADSEKELKIKITAAADTTGLVKTLDSLKSLKVDLTGLTDVNGTFKSQTEIADQAVKNQGASAKKSEESHRGLGRAMRELTAEILPGLGEGLAGLEEFSAPIAGALVLGIAMKSLAGYFREAAQAAQEAQQAMSDLDISIWHEQRDAVKDAADSLQDYVRKLNEATDSQHQLAAAEKESLAVLEAELQARSQILEAQEKAEKLAHPDQAGEIEARYGRRLSDAELAGQQEKLNLLNSQAAARAAAAPGLKSATESAAAAFAAASSDPVAAADRVRLEAAVKERDDLKKKLDADVQSYTGVGGAKGTVDSVKAQIAAADEAGEGTSETLEASRALIAKYEASQEKVAALTDAAQQSADEIKTLKEKADAAAKAFDENKTAMEALTEEIKTSARTLAIRRDTARKVQVEGYSAPGAVENIMADAVNGIADAHSGKFTEQDRNALENLKSLLATVGYNSSQVIAWLNSSKDLHRDQAAEIVALRAALERLRADLRNASGQSRSPVGAFQSP